MATNRSPVCGECPGRCCSHSRLGLGHLALTPGEADRPLFKPHITWVSVSGTKEKRALIDLAPKCPFLATDGRCSIYRRRPEACRVYLCYLHHEVLEWLEQGYHVRHRRLLNRWKVLPGQKYGIDMGLFNKTKNTAMFEKIEKEFE